MSRTRAEDSGGDVRAFPFKTMLSEGLMVSGSSDSPCAPVNPMLGLGSIVTRKTRAGGAPVEPEEAVTPLEGLRMYTINAAYAMSREAEVVILEKGKRADLAVLSHDPSAVDLGHPMVRDSPKGSLGPDDPSFALFSLLRFVLVSADWTVVEANRRLLLLPPDMPDLCESHSASPDSRKSAGKMKRSSMSPATMASMPSSRVSNWVRFGKSATESSQDRST